MLTVAPKGFHCPDAERNCNPCLDAAKACNLNNSCKKQRSTYIATCSKEDPNKGESCSKKRCHRALRSFLDRVPTEYSHRLLFCPCQTEGCAERRRQTIVPDCSYKDKEKPNCLELRRVCRLDSLCRWSKRKCWRGEWAAKVMCVLYWVCAVQGLDAFILWICISITLVWSTDFHVVFMRGATAKHICILIIIFLYSWRWKLNLCVREGSCFWWQQFPYCHSILKFYISLAVTLPAK